MAPVRQITVAPIAGPVFKVADFNSQVDELIPQMLPTPACDKAVADMVKIVKKSIQPLIPEVEVYGFSCGNLGTKSAFGVAVPEVDIVASAPLGYLASHVQGGPASNMRHHSKLDVRKVQKSTVRACTNLIVSSGFKFRRSFFRGTEAKVTFVAPSLMGIHSEAVPLDFSVNNVTPCYNMALFTECGLIDSRAKQLILLVKRWSKDRGICHAPKGHLPPYAWSLLVIYFLQVGVIDEGSILPPVEQFGEISELLAKPHRSAQTAKTSSPKSRNKASTKNSVGMLFKQFVSFYAECVDWEQETISARLGKRSGQTVDIEIHSVVNDDGSTSVAPTIEDPFDTKCNWGTCMNAMSVKRFTEEFERATDLMSKDASLAELLELWRPPEASGAIDGEGETIGDI